MQRSLVCASMLLCASMLALGSTGCGPELDIIDHGGGGDGDGGDQGSSAAGDDRHGNFPEPAMTDCGGLPDGVVAIDGLASAHLVTGPREAGSTEALVASAVPRLRLASFALDADEGPREQGDADGCGTQGWMHGFDLPIDLAPGVYPMTALVPAYPDMFEGYPDGCSFGGGWGANGPAATSGELEIFAVDDVCMVGEIRGVVQDDSSPPPNGGFVAMRAQVPCMPMFASCDDD
jgi:hypothetical protein